MKRRRERRPLVSLLARRGPALYKKGDRDDDDGGGPFSWGNGGGFRHYILKDRVPVAAPMMVWARWFENIDNRRVAMSVIGRSTIYTTFLGIPQGIRPGEMLLFETMIANGRTGRRKKDADWEDEQWRCSTWIEAEMQHARAVSQVHVMTYPRRYLTTRVRVKGVVE